MNQLELLKELYEGQTIYHVTRLFTKGTLKGLTHTEYTTVKFGVGKTYKAYGGADYKIIECKEYVETPALNEGINNNIDNDDYLTIWQQLENGHWVIVRTRPAHYAKMVTKEYNEYKLDLNRYYACFPRDINPNELAA